MFFIVNHFVGLFFYCTPDSGQFAVFKIEQHKFEAEISENTKIRRGQSVDKKWSLTEGLKNDF